MILISHFYVIQSLTDSERKTGDEVYNQMHYASLKAESKGEFKPTIELYNVDSRRNFFNVIGKILNLAKTEGVKPLLHFEMHAAEEGLVLSDDSLVTWEELKEPVRIINTFSGNNLFVSLATCLVHTS